MDENLMLEENTEMLESDQAEISEEAAEQAEEEQALDTLNSKKLLLEGEIAALEGELERRKAEVDRAAREYTEFKALFPDADPDALTGEVLELMKEGVPLSAAYALYEKRAERRNADAALRNARNTGASFGSVGKPPESDYFTPDEVRAMTRNEVRANYQKIIRSMKNWN